MNFRCNKECSEGFYGKSCQYRCKCANGAKCHSSTGRCECGPGWTGVYCDTPCPAGKFALIGAIYRSPYRIERCDVLASNK